MRNVFSKAVHGSSNNNMYDKAAGVAGVGKPVENLQL